MSEEHDNLPPEALGSAVAHLLAAATKETGLSIDPNLQAVYDYVAQWFSEEQNGKGLRALELIAGPLTGPGSELVLAQAITIALSTEVSRSSTLQCLAERAAGRRLA